ncbi:MAG: transporter substrate-binding domain-containing protein [Motiliproteus sp.]
MTTWLRKTLLPLMMALSLSSQLALGQSTVVIAIHDYAPYYNAKGQGLACDILRAAYESVGTEVRFVSFPARRAVVQLLYQQVDAFAAGNLLTHGPDRNLLNWVPLFKARTSWFYYRPRFENIPIPSQLIELRDYRLGVIVNSPFLDVYQRYSLNIVEIQTPYQLVQMARKGRIDFFEAAALTGFQMIRQVDRDSIKQYGLFTWATPVVALAFKKDFTRGQHFRGQLEEGIRIIKDNGRYLQILESYWGVGNVPANVMTEENPASTRNEIDFDKFHSQPRNSYGKILESQ